MYRVEIEIMQKLNSTDCHTGEQDLEAQQRLAEGGQNGDGMRENGKHSFSPPPPAARAPCSQRKMLVGLDILCLFVGKNNSLKCHFLLQKYEAKVFLVTTTKH